MNLIAWFVFVAAALLEVGGDAAVRQGLRGRNLICLLCGAVALGLYGLVVNLATPWGGAAPVRRLQSRLVTGL